MNDVTIASSKIPPIRPFRSKIINKTIYVREYRRKLQHIHGSLFISCIGVRNFCQNSAFHKQLILSLFSEGFHKNYSVSNLSENLILNDFDLRIWRKIGLQVHTHRTKELAEEYIYRSIQNPLFATI